MAMVAEKATAEKLSALFIQIGRWQYYLLGLVATGFIIFGRSLFICGLEMGSKRRMELRY